MSEKESKELPLMYAFGSGEKPFANLLAKSLRAVLTRPDLPAQMVGQIAMLLKACERLPLITPTVGMRITLTQRETGGGSHYQSMKFDEESISIDSGNTYYDPAVGGDHESRTLLEIGDTWREAECGWGDVKSWISSFMALASAPETEVHIEDFAESEVDWNDETTGDSFWALIKDDEDE